MSNRLHYLRLRDSLLRASAIRAASGTDPGTPLENLVTLPVAATWETGEAVSSTVIEIDLSAARPGDTFGAAGHNFSATATITLKAGSTPAASDFSTAIPWRLRTAWAVFAAQSYRYWRVEIDDAQNPDGFLSIGLLLLGSSTELSVGYVNDSFAWQDDSALRENESEIGVPHVGEVLYERSALSIAFEDVDRTQAAELRAWLVGLKGRREPLLVIPNPSHEDAIFGRLSGPVRRTGRGNAGVFFDIAAEFLEDHPGEAFRI